MRIGRSMKLVYKVEIMGLTYNPVPYKRTTQRGKFSKEYKKYLIWKTLLGDLFCSQNPHSPKTLYEIGKVMHARPNLSGAYFVEVVAIYKSDNHGDTDNIAKGVNDALFKNDKLVSGSYTYKYDKKGGLRVRIYEARAGEAIDFIKEQGVR